MPEVRVMGSSARAGLATDERDEDVAMSLWTPGGEVPIDRNGGEQPSDPGGAAQVVGGPSLDDLSPEERAQAEEMVSQMAEVQRQILAAPAAQLVTNHVVGLYELAAIHLGQSEPDLDSVRLAIDAMVAVLDATEARLGEDGAALRQALVQLQMAFVQVSEEASRAASGAEGPESAEEA